MKLEKPTNPDETDLRILAALQTDARLSYSQLGRMIHLTAPAVRERIARMEEAGLIMGYHAQVDLEKLGYSIQAFIRLSAPAESYSRVLAEVDRLPEVQSCQHVTGEDAFYLFVVAKSTGDLERLIGYLSPFGKTATAIILSSHPPASAEQIMTPK